jgi:ABC-type lipoprotein release transport system permease subunit
MPQGLMAPLRVVVQRSFADWLIVAATWLVILCAMTLVAIGVLYGDAVALTGLRQVLADQPAVTTSIAVDSRASADELGDVEPKIERALGRILGWTGGELISVLQSETYALPDQSSAERTDLALLASYEALDRHARLIAGELPTDGAAPMEVAVSSAVAANLGLSVGDEMSLTSQRGGDRTLAVRIVGIWEANDSADPYWRAEPLEIDGLTESASFTTHGPFVVGRDDLVARTASGDIGLELRALPDFDELAVEDVNWMRSDTAALERRLDDSLDDRISVHVETALDTILADVSRSLLVSRSGVVVLTIQYAVLAGYALLLVAGLLVEQRRIETALLRSRGGGVGHVVLMSFAEALILVVPAALVAPWLAVGALNLLNVAGPLADAGVRIDPAINDGVWVAVGIAAVAAVLGLILPALSSGRGLATVRQSLSRQGSRSLAQRLGIDLALVVLAAIGLWQLRQYGAPLTETVRGEIGLDPLLVAAPAIGLLAGAIVALRLVPLGAEIGERILHRRPGLVAPLGARQVARRPLRYTRSALLLMLAAALGTFAGAYASTWTRSQADQAEYRTGADIRVEVSDFPDLPVTAIGGAYRALDGVEAAMPVVRESFDVGDDHGQLLAVDADAAAGLVNMRPDLASEPIQALFGHITSDATSAAIYAGSASAFAIEVIADLETWQPPDVEEPDIPPLDPDARGILPVLVIRDADGLVSRVSGPRVALGAGAQRVEIPLANADLPGGPAYPIELLGVELEVDVLGSAAMGDIGIGSVTAAEADGERDVAIGGTAWTRTQVGAAASSADASLAPENGLITLDEPILEAGAGPDGVIRISPAADQAGPIPVLASATMVDATGVAVGDTIDLGTLGTRRTYVVTGTLAGWPTLDPNQPFVIANLGTLATWDRATGRVTSADEWWLDVSDGSASTVADQLRQPPYSADRVTANEELRRELLNDPVALGVIGSLALGALAAVIFAAIGFVVSATVSTRERLGEFALLQAIGLSHRQLSAWLSMENAFLLIVGLAAGTGLGLIMAWVVLPFVTLTQEATIAVPPIEVVIPWGIYALLYLVALGALAITVVVIGNLLARVRVSGVLRSGGE